MHRDIDEHSYLKSLLENSPDGVFTIDTELFIRYVNPAFCRILGYPAERLLGTSITEHLGDLNILGVCMAEVQKTGHCNDQETIFKRADGSVVHISKNVQAIIENDQQVREILVTIRDLTELHSLNRRLEKTLAEREEANRALQQTLDQLREAQGQLIQAEKMAALGSLVAGMAHEINTPIGIGVTSASSIREETQQIAKSLAAGTMKKSEFEAYLQHTVHGCEILFRNLNRAAELVSSFKQVAVDQTTNDWREIDLHGYLDEILLSLRPRLKQTNVSVINDCPADLCLFTNPGAIYQMVSNLVMNALLHGFPDNATGQIRLAAERRGAGIVFELGDDGIGIPAENIGRIFDPFFTTKRGQGGSGLGLHIVYNLITSTLRGRVSVDSAPGRGTRFVIDLPDTLQKTAA